MSPHCQEVTAFAAGELPPAAAEAFRHHLATCVACQGALFELAMLEAVESEARETRTPTAPPRSPVAAETGARPLAAKVVALPKPRRGRGLLMAAAVATGLAAAAAFAVAYRARPAPVAELTLGATRSMEGRLGYGPVAAHRPYDVARGERSAAGPSLAVLGALEQAGDLRGVAAGLALAGDYARAEEVLERLPVSPAVDADRSAVLLAAGRFDDALVAAERALVAEPRHPQALWNRALILGQGMGLPLGAAAAFEAVAELGEPGWSDEARTRAAALRARATAHRDQWARAREAGLALVERGELPSQEVVRAQPGYVRHHLYHAIHGARSVAELDALTPLARQLDAVSGGDALARGIAWARGRSFRVRRPLAEQYRKLYASPGAFTAAQKAALLDAARRAGERDLLLGLLLLTGEAEARAAEMNALAEARRDPWWQARAAMILARSEAARGDLAAAEARLRAGLAACEGARQTYVCGLLSGQLGELLASMHRTAEARAVVMLALPSVRLHGRDFESAHEGVLGEVARLEGAFAPMRAWLEESALRSGVCARERWVSVSVAYARASSGDLAAARDRLTQLPDCGAPPSATELDLRIQLDRVGLLSLDAPTLKAGLEAVRAHDDPEFARVLEGNYLLGHDPAQGRAVLGSIAAGPVDDPNARHARHMLAVDAAAQGDAEAVLRLAGADLGVAPPPACVLAAVVDDERAGFALRDAEGRPWVARKTFAGPLPPFAELVPADAIARLRPCGAVVVLASAPLHGAPRLLPADLPWAYGSQRPASSGGPSPSTPRAVVVADVEPPASLGLPRVGAWAPSTDVPSVALTGAAATPTRVLAELADATEVEVHAHGLVDLAVSEASYLALSPDERGSFALTAGAVREATLRGAPVVVLAACSVTRTVEHHHQPWSLPMAFVAAGARVVFGSAAPVPDAAAPTFFRAVLARIRAGEEPAVALRNERVAWLARDPASWVADVLAFH